MCQRTFAAIAMMLGMLLDPNSFLAGPLTARELE